MKIMIIYFNGFSIYLIINFRWNFKVRFLLLKKCISIVYVDYKNKMKLLIIIFVFLLHCYSKLYQVVSLTRHGARYHVNDFGDGNATEPLWG